MKFCALKAGGTAGAEDDIPSRNRCGSDRKGLRGQKIPGRDFLYYQSGAWDMYPEGALHAPEEVPLVDLAFAVYEER